ncbi:MSC_0621 family F1-like ATPase epsilon subunit [Metamycoplasma hominis]|uniref:MSC_0621 family F1-like ATPase epsilon subunit n=1 Tax=Metamycoplasma hominis TaxID=2098 RepID=UPI003DA009A1
MNNLYKIELLFLENKKLNIEKGLVYINVNEENTWEQIANTSIASYENLLLKIIDISKQNETFFVFLKNSNIVVNNNIATISTLTQPHFYIKSLNKVNLVKAIAELSDEIKFWKAKQQLGLKLEEFLKLEVLEEKYYLLSLGQELNLIEKDRINNE